MGYIKTGLLLLVACVTATGQAWAQIVYAAAPAIEPTAVGLLEEALSRLLIAVSAMAGAIGCLFLMLSKEFNACREREKNCNDRHIALLQRVARLEP